MSSTINSGSWNRDPSKPMSEGLDTNKDHVLTQFQNRFFACPFNTHSEVLPPSWVKYIASISSLRPWLRNSAWLVISVSSFGDGVAVQQSLYGVLENISIRRFLV